MTEPEKPTCICARCGKSFDGYLKADEEAAVLTWPLWCPRCLSALKARAEMTKRLSLGVN